jgi:hypothetical protein
MCYLGLVPVILALSQSYQTSDSVIAWEMVVGEKCAHFQLAYSETLSVKQLDDCVEAGSPIDLDGGRHLPW